MGFHGRSFEWADSVCEVGWACGTQVHLYLKLVIGRQMKKEKLPVYLDGPGMLLVLGLGSDKFGIDGFPFADLA